MRRIVFVCTGNTCRSPLAEHLLRKKLVERSIADVVVESAGLFAAEGAPASDGALRVGAARDLDLSAHRARPVVAARLDGADHVYVMEERHRRQLFALRVTGSVPVDLLGAQLGDPRYEIGDPIGGPDVAYERCADELDRCLERLLGSLTDEPGTGA